MKYMVCVSNKFMVSVEADSLCEAEHVVLDHFAIEINKYGAITEAQAFGKDEMKTDYFFDLMQNCETMSFETLESKVESLAKAIQHEEEDAEEYDNVVQEIEDLETEYVRRREEYVRRREELKEKRKNAYMAFKKSTNRANEKREKLGCLRQGGKSNEEDWKMVFI